MRIAIVTEHGTYSARTEPGAVVIAGRCDTCGEPLRVLCPESDEDAVCDSCGAINGRIVTRARADRYGVVRADVDNERPPRVLHEIDDSEVERGERS